MPLHKTEAIVLRTIKLGEADKIVTLFTKELGKIRAVAKGARRIKSRFGGALEPFTHINTTLYEKRNNSLFRMREAGIVHPYHRIREDIDRIIYGLYLLEAVDKFLLEADVNKEISSFLTDTLALLNKGDNDVKAIFIFFGLKFLRLIGYQYRFDKCIVCSDDPLISFFSPHKGGLVCNDCIRNDRRGAQPINKSTALYLRDIQRVERDIGAEVLASSMPLNEAEEIIKGIFTEILGRPLFSQKLINETFIATERLSSRVF